MAISILESLTGDTINIGSKNVTLLVITSGPGTVKFEHQSGPNLTGIPTGEVNIDVATSGETETFYAQAGNIQVPGTVTAGTSTTILVTPYDEQHVAGTAKTLKLTYQAFTDISGKVVLTNGDFVLTPADKEAEGSYWRVAMEAQNSAGNAALGGVMVRFAPLPSTNIEVWTDVVNPLVNPPVTLRQLTPIGSFYYVPTDPATGQAAVRIVTLGTVFNQFIQCQVAMNSVNDLRQADCFFANNDDPNADTNWLAPSAIVNMDGNIQIPEYGDTFSLAVNVNNEDDASFVRYVVMNNETAYPYEVPENGDLPIDYANLIQDPTEGSNQFTYVRMTSNGNVKASPKFGPGVDGSRSNLPNPRNTPRVLPPPLIIPDPGSSKTIALGTLSLTNTLRLQLTNFKKTLLTGYTGGALTVEFKCYMNGYKRNGDDRPSHVYSSRTQPALYVSPIPTVSVDGADIKFSQDHVDLSYGASVDWGRNPFTNEIKKVGFEYIISDATGQKWYSEYDAAYSWYRISTGNW